MKRSIAMLLTLILTLTLLAGCSPSEQDLLVGKWKGTADLAETYQTMLAAADPSLASCIDIENFQVEMTLRFDEDGTYSWTVDEEDLAAGTKNMLQAIREGLASYLEAQTGMSAEQALAASGLTMDEVMAQYFDPNISQTIRSSLESKGTWEIEDGELTLTDKDGYVTFRCECDLGEEELKLKTASGTELLSKLLPLTFEKD